jgi:signal transduction histidine kinase
MESTIALPFSPLRRPWSLLNWTQAGRASLFLVLDFPIGLATGLVVTVLLIVGGSLLVTFFAAVPVLWLAVEAGHRFSSFERWRFAELLGVSIDQSEPRRLARKQLERGVQGWSRALWEALKSKRTWREFLYHVLMIPVGALSYSAVVISWTLALVLLSAPLVLPALPDQYADLYFTKIHAGRDALAVAAVGVLVVLVIPQLMMSITRARISMARSLLGNRAASALEARVEELQVSRSALVAAVDAERKRIERDLHDGAQQRLVAVAMDLGMVKSKLEASEGVSPDVRQLIESAHSEAKRAIAELRDVARGVHPAILEDRGLGPALSSLAARCPVPVRVDVDMSQRPSRSIEAVAYYVVAETLTNIAKHASASRVTVAVTRVNDRLNVSVTDDGKGGAVIGDPGGLGGGLAGLRDRLSAVDGRLAVDSPLGGPTIIRAEMPCES